MLVFDSFYIGFWIVFSFILYFGSFKESVSGSRRSRLSVLRSRMQKEFGVVFHGNMNSAEDEAGSTSESASLASWGRNLIMEHSPLTVGPFYPADSISTKAFSLIGTSGSDSFR